MILKERTIKENRGYQYIKSLKRAGVFNEYCQAIESMVDQLVLAGEGYLTIRDVTPMISKGINLTVSKVRYILNHTKYRNIDLVMDYKLYSGAVVNSWVKVIESKIKHRYYSSKKTLLKGFIR